MNKSLKITCMLVAVVFAVGGFSGVWAFLKFRERAREASIRNGCRFNLRTIQAGKDVYQLDESLAVGTPVALTNLVPRYIHRPHNNIPPGGVIDSCIPLEDCRAGGTYEPNPIGSNPACSVHGDLLGQAE